MNYKRPNFFKFLDLTVQRLAQSVSRWITAREFTGLDSLCQPGRGVLRNEGTALALQMARSLRDTGEQGEIVKETQKLCP